MYKFHNYIAITRVLQDSLQKLCVKDTIPLLPVVVQKRVIVTRWNRLIDRLWIPLYNN